MRWHHTLMLYQGLGLLISSPLSGQLDRFYWEIDFFSLFQCFCTSRFSIKHKTPFVWKNQDADFIIPALKIYVLPLCWRAKSLSSTWTLWLMSPPGLWHSSASVTSFIQITILILAHRPPFHLHAVELMWACVLESESVSRSIVSNSLQPCGL